MCRDCGNNQLRETFNESFVVKDMGDYTIATGDHTVPVVKLKDGGKPTLKELAEQTEEYRIKKMLFLCKPGCEDDTRGKALEYLLRCWDKLTPEQSVEVINQANRLLGAAGVEDDIKVKVALTLKKFTGVRDSKKEKPVGFEQLLQNGGHIELEGEDEPEREDPTCLL